MSDNSFRSRSPVHRVAVEKLARWVDLEGTGRMTLVPFEREVAWIRESETSVALRNDIGDGDLQAFGTYNDYYGYLGSLTGALEDVPGTIRAYGLGADTFLRVDLTVTVVERPVVPPAKDEPLEYGRFSYLPCPKDWLLADLVPAWEAASFADRVTLVPSPQLASRVICEEPAWSSRWMDKSPVAQLAMSLAVLGKVVDGEVPDGLRKAVLDRLQDLHARFDQAKAGV